MQSKNFSIVRAFKFAITSISSWHNFSRLVPAMLMSSIAVFLIGHQTGQFLWNNYRASFFLYCLGNISFSCQVSALMMRMGLDIYDSGKTTLMGALLSIKDIILKYILLCLIMMLIIAGGFILLVIPAIIFGLFFMFAPLVLIDKKVGVLEALRESKLLGAGIRMKLFAYLAVWITIGALWGGAAFLIGVGTVVHVIFYSVIAAILGSISLLTLVFVYRNLQRK